MRPYTFENSHWVFFGYGEGWPPEKCEECMALVESEKRPNRHCINCWKLELFYSNCTDVEAVWRYLLDAGRKDRILHGKRSKFRMELTPEFRAKITSVPEEGHPDPDAKEDGAILIYCQSIAERDARAATILKGLNEKGLYKKGAISSRRGCLNFDELIGPWKGWYPLDSDWPQPPPPRTP